ncbi:transmembrane protein, putative (macronuclear) [Tetrahymena thermophila SB210]|uniref:Transmembrane protein, putative n=1 Tax=Tetrahymena thermophila (strain SB210) TaxID=312017 RepID=Q22UN2_TETTS|nr:transmembrane protein, putative [Tetrahymena thermophila SB210]EAR88938.1 transmembrane protein, putative [Tetrahymena thermophila SB210]|eukprot:XP_001009183.1 transmembrane protein, putative [Tetrahymena thermophila SB210]
MINQNIGQSQVVRQSTITTVTTNQQPSQIRASQGSQGNPYSSQSQQSNQYKSEGKVFALILLLISLGLFIYFQQITDRFDDYDECKKLYVASKINEYVWYYGMFLQFYFLTLAFGSDHWKCYYFQQDLPKYYNLFNSIFGICILGMTIALQICLNYNEKCGNLTDQVRGYLAVGYIVLVIVIIYVAFTSRKGRTSSGAIQNPNTQTVNENSRLQQNSYQPYVDQ